MADVRIKVLKNGPLEVTGAAALLDCVDAPYAVTDDVVYLCRCGQSNNKPFCDGSHNHHGFRDEPQARDLPPKKVP